MTTGAENYNKISQNLDRLYGLFANANEPWVFFSGLINYFSYVLKTPELKKIVDREMQKRNAMLWKRDRFEKGAIEELKGAKEKLLSVIERNKVDVTGFDQAASWIPNPREKGETILTSLKFFEEGKISISGNYSDNLEHYLYDIAANLFRLGHEKEIKDFIVSNEEYARYYAKINDDGGSSSLVFAGNTRGAFIFSKTWPLRFEQDRAIERARKLEPWGAFEALIELCKAREAALDDKNLRGIVSAAFHDKDYVFNTRDAVNIAYAAEDIKTLMKGNNIDEQQLRFLKINKFRSLSASAHSYLLQNLISEPDGAKGSSAKTMALKRKIEEAERGMVNKAIGRMGQFMDKYESTLERMDVFMKDHESEQYKKEEAERKEQLERMTEEVEAMISQKKKSKPKMIKIKTARLDGLLLIINGGQESISFNSNAPDKNGEEAESSKTFKVFNLLWADHYEIKDRSVTNKNTKMISAANLMKVGDVPTEGALKKLIVRLNARFADNGLKIKVSGKGGKYKLSVNFE